MKVEIDKEKADKIQKYVEANRFKSADEFVDKAVTLLLYAENNREMFEGLIKERKDEQKQ